MNKVFSAYLNVTGYIRGFITWPFRILAMTIGIPNFKIIYKSGRAEYLFLKSISINKPDWSWETVTGTNKRPVLFGVDSIAAVYQLY